MPDKAPAWVVPLMRFGYASRGAVYLIVGVLALMAAIWGGQTDGTQGALAQLKAEPMGNVALWIIAVGLMAFAIWRLVAAAMDLDDHGSDGKGTLARLGQAITGLIHAALGISVAIMAAGSSSGGGGSGAEGWTAKLMSMPFGQILVGLVGAVTIGAGGYYGYKAMSEKYKAHLRLTPLTQKLDPVMKAGLIAHGIVVVIIGGFLIYAAIMAEPGQAGGLQQTFDTVRSVAFGRFLLIALAAGVVCFAVFCFIEAVYRIVPRRAGPNVRTLAHKANLTH